MMNIESWNTSPEYSKEDLEISLLKFEEVTNLLLERPNLNSSHLFRADILYDSAKIFQTLKEKEDEFHGTQTLQGDTSDDFSNHDDGYEVVIKGYILKRTIIRRLIPRKPQLDQPLEQSCFIYRLGSDCDSKNNEQLVVYVPHVKSEAEMPWYHPLVRALAYRYRHAEKSSSISVHYLPFAKTTEPTPNRLHRTFISLLQTIVRLTKLDKPEIGLKSDSSASSRASSRSTAPSALKDTILPQHIVQDTYTQLKQKYATDLINRWVENTEPSKHVFEDISIAAFLIELWKQMYQNKTFPGFIDIACGNGVLVYILIQEGYQGRGFDARRRKTWEILEIDQYLEEKICIPKPFLDTMNEEQREAELKMAITDGVLPADTFIISNHADELTPWTPILAALSSPQSPLPFIAIPCCSHALSGARHRYFPKDIDVALPDTIKGHDTNGDDKVEDSQSPQPQTGDLKVLRLQKARAASHTDDKSQYSCLTKKVVALAEEIGFDIEMTLMRIPSTRNIGIVGNRKAVMTRTRGHDQDVSTGNTEKGDDVLDKIDRLIQRECTVSGGIDSAAKIWIERAKKLQAGSGRGKVNLGGKPEISIVAHQD